MAPYEVGPAASNPSDQLVATSAEGSDALWIQLPSSRTERVHQIHLHAGRVASWARSSARCQHFGGCAPGSRWCRTRRLGAIGPRGLPETPRTCGHLVDRSWSLGRAI